MGAEFNFTTTDAQTSETVRQFYEKLHEQALYDHGHAGYSGTWAETGQVVIMEQPEFETDHDAESWLLEHAEKWQPALAVQVAMPHKHWAIGAWCSS